MLGAALVLSGCTLGPHYRPPRAPLPATFVEHAATQAEIARTDAELRDWWTQFKDPLLDAIVERAIAGNLDLQAAAQRVIEARAERNETASALQPQVSFGASFTDEHVSNSLEYPPLPAGQSTFARVWQLGPMLNWQIDVFGQIRRQIEAANATLGATVEQRRGVLLSVLGEIALDYAGLRASQLRQAIAERNVRAAQDALNLVDRSFAEGLGTSLQVAQQRAELETEQSTLAPLHTAIVTAAHALAVLTGSLPDTFTAALERPAPLPVPPPLPVSLPSTVLLERPDIRAAEQQYHAAFARIGVAIASRYPTFTIPIVATPQSSFIHILFQSVSFTWQLGLSSTVPLYTGGRLRNQEVAARAAAEAARLQYENTVLTAFREVEDGIVATDDEIARADRLRAAAADSRLALERADLLYGRGLTGFLDVLTAERSLFNAEDAAAVSELARLQDIVRLFQALGGGWQGVP